MARPTTRREFFDYCLRRLGAPVIDINVDPEQVEDRIDEALLYYMDYHYDGSNRVLYRHQVTEADVANGYITLPQSVIGVHDLLPIGSGSGSSSLFNVNYQIRLNEMFDISSSTFIHYYLAMQHINLLNELFTGKKILRYNRHINKLYIDMDWNYEISPGQYLVIDCYQITDPEEYSDVWADRWLARYATALIKRQWADNMGKFEGIQMPGGLTFNASRIRDEAQTEIDKLEEEMIISYSLPVTDFIG